MKKCRLPAFGFLVPFFLLVATSGFAQTGLSDFYSPSFLAAGAGGASLLSPVADAVNPAASGGAQRVTLDLSYIALPGLGAVPGWGNAVNAGITVPSPIGVFSGSARFLSSPFPSLDIGSFGGFNFSFAKDLFSDLYVGAGLGVQIGTDWGLGLDLGFIHIPGDLWILKDFRWSFALRNMGKGFVPQSSSTWIGTSPPAFTPDFGASFSLLKTDAVAVKFSSNLSFPSFQDIRFSLGGELAAGDLIFLTVSSACDLAEMITGTGRPVPVSFGLAVKLKTNIAEGSSFLDLTKRGWNKNEVTITSAAAPLQNGVWGIGIGANIPLGALDRTPPVINVGAPGAAFLSPGKEGTLGVITFPLSITDGRYIKGYRISVQDSEGAAVHTIQRSEEVPSRKRAQDYVDRFLSVKKRLAVPPSFSWDGTTDTGAIAADGPYTCVVEAWDDNGNIAKSGPVQVLVQTTPPSVALNLPSMDFSPNGDGVKDAIRIIPSVKAASGIQSHELRIMSATGIVVKRFAGKDVLPAEVAWDGLTDLGIPVPDGIYSAELEVLDRNGNRPVARGGPITVDTVPPSISQSADSFLFSPDGDGFLDQFSIRQVSSDEETWEGAIQDLEGKNVKTYSWKGRAPDFFWDGKDAGGRTAPDGLYRYIARALDKAGNRTVKTLEGIRVDTRPTPISISASSAGLSPNGDEFRDTIGFSLTVGQKEEIKSWKVSLANAITGTQREFFGIAPVPDALYWDGKKDSGSRADEGTYTARFTVDYAKGNRPEAKTSSFVLSVSAPKLQVNLSPALFSPDDDGTDDRLTISLKTTAASPIESWQIAILDPMEHFFASFSGKGTPPATLTWNGLSSKGELVQSAEDYPLIATVRDELGNTATLRTLVPVDVLVLRDGARLKVRITSITFKPNTPDYVNVPSDRAEKNLSTIQRLAQIFAKYSQYRIRMEGHAVMVHWEDPVAGKREQDLELIPLSKARADAIKGALGKYGIVAARITTAGIGGAQPIVPFGDLENRWKNRRVEFILEK